MTEFWMFEDARHNINAFCIYLFRCDSLCRIHYSPLKNKQELIDTLNKEEFKLIKNDDIVDINCEYNNLLENSGKNVEGSLWYKIFKDKKDLIKFIEDYFK